MGWLKGKPLTKEHRHKLSISRKGRTVPPDVRKKIARGLRHYYKTHIHHDKGKTLGPRGSYKRPTKHLKGPGVFTEQHCKNLSVAKKRYWNGKREETGNAPYPLYIHHDRCIRLFDQ